MAIILCFFVSVKICAQIIPEERIVDWSGAGLMQNIEEPSQIVSVVDFGAVGNGVVDDTQAIQDAINALEENAGILFFPSGIYFITESLSAHSGLIIRGEGSEETHLKFLLSSDSQNAINVTAAQSSTYFSVLSGFEKESYNLELSSTSGFQIGDFLEIRQENGDWDIVPINWAEKSVGQILQISQISGNEIDLEHALRFSYDASLNPEIRKISPISNVIIENLEIERLDEPSDGGGKNIFLSYAVNCRISGVESSKSQGSHLYLTNSSNVFIFGNYFHNAFLFDGVDTRGYGVTLNRHTGEVLVENNIFRNLRHAMMVKTGANGNVFSYNYSREPHRSEQISDFSGDISLHGHYAYANLFEENICQNIIIDHYWGPSGPHNTFFRNRTELYGLIMTTNNLLETKFQNFVGNEIVGSYPFGNYVLSGSDHFEYGINKNGAAVPSGTDDLEDVSYFYAERPWFLESSFDFPGIGYPNALNQWLNPAKVRYDNGEIMTVEIDNSVGIGEIDKVSHKIKIVNNPVDEILKLEIKTNIKICDYSVYSLSGIEMLKGEISITSNIVEIPVSKLASNLYLIKISSPNSVEVLKFLKR